MSRDKPAYKTAADFCRAYLGRGCFAPLTGQDMSGWHAFVYLVEMWSRSDAYGRAAAISAMRSVLGGVQQKEPVHQVFCQTIPALVDWCHVKEIWPLLLQASHDHPGTPWNLTAVTEVTEEHRRREQREDQRLQGKGSQA